MTDLTTRDQLVEWLTAALPAGWKLINSERNFDVLVQTAVIIKQDTIAKLPQAPRGAWTVSYTLTIADPHKKFEDAEIALDEDVLELFEILDLMDNVYPSTAKKVVVNDSYLGYDVTVAVITQRKTS